MGKRLLTGFLAMCLLLGGCSADRESSVSSGIEETALSSELDESKEMKEPTDDKTIQQLLQNAEWLTVQLSYALNYSSDTPSFSADPFACFLQTERFIFSGKDYLDEEGYLYPNAFYETKDEDGFSSYHFPREEVQLILWEVLGIDIPDGWNTIFVSEDDEYLQYFTVEYGPGGVEISEIKSELKEGIITVSYTVRPRIKEDQSILVGRYQNQFRICAQLDGREYLRLETVKFIEK